MRGASGAALGAMVLAGCGSAEPAPGLPAIVTQEEQGGIPGARLELKGTLLRTGAGCLVLVRESGGGAPWIVWPPGAVADGLGVNVGGEVFVAGDEVTGVGAVAVLADIPGGAHDDTYYGEPGHLCDGDSAGVAVLDNIVHVGS